MGETNPIVKNSLTTLESTDLNKIYPLPFLGKEVTNGELLLIFIIALGLSFRIN